MTRSTIRSTLAVAAALLVAGQASTASANRLLDERWITRASKAQVAKEIAAGADVNAVEGRQYYTPLIAASKHGNLGAMQALLDGGADPNQPTKPGGYVPMHWAANGQAVALLFEYGARIDERIAETGFTPLHWAAVDSRLDTMHALIRRGADIEARNEFGVRPLHRAAKRGQPAAAQILLAAGADVNATTTGQAVPLFSAAKFNTPQMVEVLLDAGADPTARTEEGWYPAETATNRNPRVRRHPVMARLVDPLLDIPAAGGCSPETPSGPSWPRASATSRAGRSWPGSTTSRRPIRYRSASASSCRDPTLVFHVFGALAQFERDLIRERTMAGLAAARARGRQGGRPSKLTPELRRQAEAMLRDRKGYPFISDVIRSLPIGRTAFYHHFPKERIREFRG